MIERTKNEDMLETKWVEDKKNGKHWTIVCHACRTVSHHSKDFKRARCTECGVDADRPAREQRLPKVKKKVGFV